MLEINEKSELNHMNNKEEPLIDDNHDLTEEEILKCKENGFILIGKTGVGKTSLLNVIYGNEVGKVGHTSKSETKQSNYYCVKEFFQNEIIYFSIIDTPGLYDTQGVDVDINQKKDIQLLVSKEKIKIKGILFLSNFQNERFDYSEQATLLEYNALFPMKDFWNRLILIFTHFYSDPDGDSKEEIQERSLKNFTSIINRIMEKIKDVSNPIEFIDLNRKYINIYSKIKNEKQIQNNKSIRDNLLLEISKYVKFNPMFNSLQIFHFKKYEIEEKDEYIYDCDLIIYLDLNDNIISSDLNILKKYPKINNYNKEEAKIECDIKKCKVDEQGNLINTYNEKEGIFSDTKSKLGGGLTLISVIGIIFSGIFFFPTIPVCITSLVGGLYMIKNSSDEKEKNEQIKIIELIEEKKIDEEIKKAFEKLKLIEE